MTDDADDRDPGPRKLGERFRELERQERKEADPWRLPELSKFGAQFEALERQPDREIGEDL